ncbi:helix-turn-helix transcriptional regulator [Streptomyces sp. I05A-00742]|uniref:helix-turn-helix domain-containing protein n=1 Tax=Streptomyces sp. I05A-00742 TaxID=2732853 RepID=UPI002899727E|nr:helix-turn-helix transcriptional regulator [Streptomyces sp. I05A-00742]
MPAPKELDPLASLPALYGSKLRKLRLRAGLTQKQLGAKVPIAHSRIAQFELGKEVPHEDISTRLDELLGAEGELIALREHIKRAPVTDVFLKFFDFEAKATAMHKYMAHHVPGLLQTETYAREVIGSAQPWLSAEELAAKVATRMGRQRLLVKSDAPLLWSVLDESVIRRPVGGPAAMRDQLLRVLEAAKTPNVEVQVLPFGAGCHPLMGGSLTLLSFKNAPNMAYLEGDLYGHLVNDSAAVARHAHRYDLVHAAALHPDPSIAMIERLVEEYDKCAHRAVSNGENPPTAAVTPIASKQRAEYPASSR